jgi:hypothetical protein
MFVLLPLLSIGAIYTFIPIIIILILIAAAAGLTRGMDLFALFGIGTLMGLASGGSRGVGKGLTSANKYKATPAKFTSVGVFSLAGKGANTIQTQRKGNKKILAKTIADNLKNGGILTNVKNPQQLPKSTASNVKQGGIKMALSPYAVKNLQKNIKKMQGNGIGTRDVLHAVSAGRIKGTQQHAAEKAIKIAKKGIVNQHLIDEKGWGIVAASIITSLGIAPLFGVASLKKTDEMHKLKEQAKRNPEYKDIKGAFAKPSKNTPIIGPYYELYSYAKVSKNFITSIHSKDDLKEKFQHAVDLWRAKTAENYYAASSGISTSKFANKRPFLAPNSNFVPLPVDEVRATKEEYKKRKELIGKSEEYNKKEKELQLKIDKQNNIARAIEEEYKKREELIVKSEEYNKEEKDFRLNEINTQKKIATSYAQEKLEELNKQLSTLKKERENELQKLQEEYDKAYRRKVDAYASFSGPAYFDIINDKMTKVNENIRKSEAKLSKYKQGLERARGERMENEAKAWDTKITEEQKSLKKLNNQKEYLENLLVPLKQKLVYEHFKEPEAYGEFYYENVNKPTKDDIKKYYWNFGAIPTYMDFSNPVPTTPKGEVPTENEFYARQWRIHQRNFRDKYKEEKRKKNN